MGKIGWRRGVITTGSWQGFNDSGFEHFKQDPIKGLGREIIQNSSDAAADIPVRVSFNLMKVKVSDIPGYEDFQKTIQACAKGATREGKRAKEFFQKANSLLKEDEIDVLRIDDFNTSGLMGPCENGTPYFALMKATGQSVKSSNDAGGSFGIGKSAPYLVSNFRTVFVSTYYQNNEKNKQFLAQGKSILMSYEEEHEAGLERYEATGYWGIKDLCKPVASVDSIPDWLKRPSKGGGIAEIGTSIFTLGFNGGRKWEARLAEVVIENFFAAVLAGRLEVEINGKFIITKASLKNIIEKVEEECTDSDSLENLSKTKQYCDVYTGDDDVIEEIYDKDPSLGRCKLKLVVKDKFPKKVVFLRNGMTITDDLKGLKRFNNFKDFVGIFECIDKQGNALLREMEPPAHDDFQASRVKNGNKILKNLANWIRTVVRHHATNPIEEVTVIDELSEFFEDEVNDSGGDKEMNPKTIEITDKKRSNSANGVGAKGGDGSGEDGLIEPNQKKSKTKGGRSDPTEGGKKGKGVKGGKVIPLRNFRAGKQQDGWLTIYFTPEHSGKANIRLYAAGVDKDYLIKLNGSERGTVEKGYLVDELIEGERYTQKVLIGKKVSYALKVVANEA